MPTKQIKVKIQRNDPTANPPIFFQSYEVPIVDEMSVLDVLDYIHENLDSTLAYFHHDACRRGVCSRCTIRVDGKPGLACQVIAVNDMTLTPTRDSVTRDLVLQPPKRN